MPNDKLKSCKTPCSSVEFGEILDETSKLDIENKSKAKAKKKKKKRKKTKDI